jgi:hypothetical protein
LLRVCLYLCVCVCARARARKCVRVWCECVLSHSSVLILMRISIALRNSCRLCFDYVCACVLK